MQQRYFSTSRLGTLLKRHELARGTLKLSSPDVFGLVQTAVGKDDLQTAKRLLSQLKVSTSVSCINLMHQPCSPVEQSLTTPCLLQIQLTQLTSLAPTLENTPNAQKELTLASMFDVQSLDCHECHLTVLVHIIAGDTLELAVFMSVKLQDEAAFERNYQQLQMYTSDGRQVPMSRRTLLSLMPALLTRAVSVSSAKL